MKDFLKWFKTEGFKKSIIPLVIALVLDVALIKTGGSMWTDGDTGASTTHLVIVTLLHLVLIGFNVGIVYDMLTRYKFETNKKK